MNENQNKLLMPKSKKEERKERKEKDSKKSKTRFTSLDFFFVVVVLLCVVGIGFRGTIAEFFMKAEPTEKVEISFKAEGLRENEVVGITRGEEFFLDEHNEKRLGVVNEIESFLELDRYTVKGSLTVDGRYTDTGLVTADNHPLYVNKILNIYSGTHAVTVQITEIPRK